MKTFTLVLPFYNSPYLLSLNQPTDMSRHILSALGVHENALSDEEKTFMDQNGYLNLGRLLNDDEVQAIRDHLAGLMQEEGENAGSELLDSKHIRHPKEAGADRLADLVNKGAIFDRFYTHPRVLAAVAHVLGPDLQLSSLNYRAAKPGMGLQKLHADWHEAVKPGEYKVCNSIWLLDDFTPENGATRIVPGTHLKGNLPDAEMPDPMERHPQEILIEAPAGTVVIFNSHTWHGGTTNRTLAPRRAIHSYFCRGDQPQQIDQARYIRAETRERLGTAGIWVLGVERRKTAENPF